MSAYQHSRDLLAKRSKIISVKCLVIILVCETIMSKLQDQSQ